MGPFGCPFGISHTLTRSSEPEAFEAANISLAAAVGVPFLELFEGETERTPKANQQFMGSLL